MEMTAGSYGRKKEMQYIVQKLRLLQIPKETFCLCFIFCGAKSVTQKKQIYRSVHTHLFMGVFSVLSYPTLIHRLDLLLAAIQFGNMSENHFRTFALLKPSFQTMVY